MSKSILVLDTPENCKKCDFFAERLCGNGRCILNKYSGNIVPSKTKAANCPLKEINKTSVGIEVCIGNQTECVQSYVDGYNDCVDQILREHT